MTVILTAARGDATKDGIQPFDARRHLRPVAELVGQVFAGEMDASGRSALEEMQTLGRWSPVLGGILGSALFADFVSGFVWIEAGKIVGNVTLQRQEESGTRWRISNVAVSEPYRGRGIARLMMMATLREIARRGGSWALLQVRVDNPPARHLYERLGFADVCQDGVWYAAALPSAVPEPDPELPLRLLSGRDWFARFELARDARAPLAQWAEPINPALYRSGPLKAVQRLVGEATGLRRMRAWGLWQDQHMLWGEVEVTANGMGEADGMRLAVRPGAPEGLAHSLVARGLQGLRDLHGSAPVRAAAEYRGELAGPPQALEDAGFRPRRVLLTMRRLLTPADANMAVPGLD